MLFFFINKKEDALKKLLAIKLSNPEFNEVDYYLGRAYAANHKFDEAITSYNRYISEEITSNEQKDLAKHNVVYCENAKLYMQDSLSVEIVNVGFPINTDYSEYVPVITPDESMLIFTYRGERSLGGGF